MNIIEISNEIVKAAEAQSEAEKIGDAKAYELATEKRSALHKQLHAAYEVSKNLESIDYIFA